MSNLKDRGRGKVSKKKLTKTKKSLGREVPELRVLDADVAEIDIGSQSHFVAVPTDRIEIPVQEFECFTADIYEMVAWLKACRIRKVAMESTGVYWIPIYDILSRVTDIALRPLLLVGMFVISAWVFIFWPPPSSSRGHRRSSHRCPGIPVPGSGFPLPA